MTEELKKQIEEFREKTEQFSKGEISVKDYKGYSGRFGSYAQKGAKSGDAASENGRRQTFQGQIKGDH